MSTTFEPPELAPELEPDGLFLLLPQAATATAASTARHATGALLRNLILLLSSPRAGWGLVGAQANAATCRINPPTRRLTEPQRLRLVRRQPRASCQK